MDHKINDFTFLYLGTGAMLLLSLCFIGLVLWNTWAFRKQKLHTEQRDKFWCERIDGVEALVRTEFQVILQQLKKI